ncbi:MAG: ribbon-helix-helix domain-containing protein [Lactobacillaceae bacterium]|jgi:predicted DNA-binding ribbon-helix-helix protein|nr:ribbon-helix-helix domain-containing protein [Lactobacillaceae bacterium]
MLKKSVVIANRHETSISLEEDFFEELKIIAKDKKLSINQLVTLIDGEREEDNLSSAIRVYILRYVKNNRSKG